jgi:hypothetical protein
MKEQLVQFLARLEGSLRPICNAVEQLLSVDTETTEENDAFLISRRPKIAPQAYACVLYRGLSEVNIDRYLQKYVAAPMRSSVLTDSYREVLRVLNGADVYQLSLFGVPPSMCADPPLPNRRVRQPLDIGEANTSWFTRYMPAPNHLHFGSGPFSPNENLGYFLSVDGSVKSLHVGGTIFNAWGTMREFLEDEIHRYEASFAEYEESMFLFRQELERTEAEKRAKRRPKKHGLVR